MTVTNYCELVHGNKLMLPFWYKSILGKEAHTLSESDRTESDFKAAFLIIFWKVLDSFKLGSFYYN